MAELELLKAQLRRFLPCASELGPKVSAVKVDASNPNSIKEAVKESTVVLNRIGPFYNIAG